MKSMLALIIASAMPVAYAASDPPALSNKISELAGSAAIDCSPKKGQLEEAVSCARDAISASQAFRFVMKMSCSDCQYWNAAIGSDQGLLWELVYDTNPTGSLDDSPVLLVKKCSTITLNAESYPYILCSSTADR